MRLEQKDLSRMLETAVVAARLAGQKAMEEISYVKTSIKGPDQLVTQADVICQQIIIERIKEAYPDDGFIAEEGNAGGMFKQPPRGSKRVWWAIDPIDGTNNFAKGMLLFSVSVAAMYEGEPVVGVIFDPATESMFTGVKGEEAQLNGRRISVSEDGFDQFSSIGTDSFFDNGVPKWVISLMERARSRTLGSSCLHLAYLAKGSLIAVIVTRANLWDIAAGTLIAKAAKAKVSNWLGDEIFPVDLWSYEGQLFQIVAANSKVHSEIVHILNQ